MKTKNTSRYQKGMITILMTAASIIFAYALHANPASGLQKGDKTQYDAEPEITTEHWMLDPACWVNEGDGLYLCEATEKEMAIEPWMVDLSDGTWYNPSEESIAFEEWMANLNDEFWSEILDGDIPLQTWMSHPETWSASPDEKFYVAK